MKAAKIGKDGIMTIPEEFRFSCEEVMIQKIGNTVLLCPKDSFEARWIVEHKLLLELLGREQERKSGVEGISLEKARALIDEILDDSHETNEAQKG